MTDVQTYSQPTKIAARLASLKHAVELLTTRREAAAIVPADHGRLGRSLVEELLLVDVAVVESA